MRRRTGYVRRGAGRDLHLHADLHWIDRLSRADAARAYPTVVEDGKVFIEVLASDWID